jgi:hypothetical protein
MDSSRYAALCVHYRAAYCVHQKRSLQIIGYYNAGVVVVVVVVGVRGKPQMYYSLLAYCTTRF